MSLFLFISPLFCSAFCPICNFVALCFCFLLPRNSSPMFFFCIFNVTLLCCFLYLRTFVIFAVVCFKCRFVFDDPFYTIVALTAHTRKLNTFTQHHFIPLTSRILTLGEKESCKHFPTTTQDTGHAPPQHASFTHVSPTMFASIHTHTGTQKRADCWGGVFIIIIIRRASTKDDKSGHQVRAPPN